MTYKKNKKKIIILPVFQVRRIQNEGKEIIDKTAKNMQLYKTTNPSTKLQNVNQKHKTHFDTDAFCASVNW